MLSIFSAMLGEGLGDVARDPTNDFWFTGLARKTPAGTYVTDETARQSSAVRRCIAILAETIAVLPLNVYQRTSTDGDAEVAVNHPLQRILHDAPGEGLNSFDFRDFQQIQLLSRGMAYARIIPGKNYFVGGLDIMPAQRVIRLRVPDQPHRFVYQYTDEAGHVSRYSQDDVWTLRGLPKSSDPYTGLAPIDYEAQVVIGAALAAMDYGARFWANDATPTGIIHHPGKFKGGDERMEFLRSWKEARTGVNRHKTAVLEGGLKFESMGIPNNQSQFLETRKYTDSEICRIFGVPPHLIGIFDGATHSNVEQQALDFVKYSLGGWLGRWEQSINQVLLLNDPRFFAKFNLDALLRGDLKTRYEAYAIGRNWGWLSPNDVRRREDMNKIPAKDGGDDFLRPANMIEADEPPGGNVQPSGQKAALFGRGEEAEARAYVGKFFTALENAHERGQLSGRGGKRPLMLQMTEGITR